MMSKDWIPPKGINVIYKGKGHRKKSTWEEHKSIDKKDKKDKDESD